MVKVGGVMNNRIRPCSDDWVYCDGDCKDCARMNVITSTSTKVDKANPYPKYSYNSGLRYSNGEPCYGEDLDWIYHEAENGNI